jgi:hypothetical protein
LGTLAKAYAAALWKQGEKERRFRVGELGGEEGKVARVLPYSQMGREKGATQKYLGLQYRS